MCDYSLENVATRPAQVGDRLVSGKIGHSLTRGFSPIGNPNVAVCLCPGTEIAFEEDIVFEAGPGFLRTWTYAAKTGVRVARFRQVDTDRLHVHHDALEFPDGEIVLLTRLAEGQHATVLQLPAREAPVAPEQSREPISVV